MKTKILATFAAMLIFVTTQANALVYTFDLNNSGLSPGPWATITLTDTTVDGKDAVLFQVVPLESSFSALSSNFGLDDFYFNENTNLANISDVVKLDFVSPNEWELKYPDKGYGGVASYGKFEMFYKGSGNSRANPLEFYLYTIDPLLNIQATQFAVTGSDTNYMFGGHIGGFVALDAAGNPILDEKGEPITSAQFASSGTPVPEPGTVTLFGLGLAGIALYARRRNKK